jgi:hypothetical protein
LTQLVEASPLELRRRIAAIPSGEIEVPDQSPRFPMCFEYNKVKAVD